MKELLVVNEGAFGYVMDRKNMIQECKNSIAK